jgi:hypothetical protein
MAKALRLQGKSNAFEAQKHCFLNTTKKTLFLKRVPIGLQIE